jgi:phosphatidylserine decarboxylase
MARFNMGSTVIVLLPGNATLDALAPQQAVQVGQRVGTVQDAQTA